ncbi:hypothetical protein MATR_10660 [Marivirga tractuosa]|uniref:DUF4249 domain-containing protein n=1 Tax=Marivirga tractuosa (strain ATCC 23168 / DSM 4126 / NBRC 15989 / NCIMB 1408 / VKM B-1430 / H-43) TaxID=643867 RepID=E4TLI4_MARTH|nr:DUF4249 family protein [Marivirga tractuosa]ADR21305.1 hypothetical protein Ftrac_1315 [Marivirga tractuosa DSM 4126]BDD14241.1 hypothetical protein MATR_10660 [Marivirga tractuosa]
MRANRNKILSVLFAVLLNWSCQNIIDLDLEQSDTRLVIEGEILDKNTIKRIRVSQSLNYYDTGRMSPVTDADISLLDENDNLISSFFYNSQDSIYQTPDSLTLDVGSAYKIQIEANEELLEATGKILENPTVDSIYYLSDQELMELGQPVFEEGYFLFVNGKLNNEGVEYFKLDISVNDTLQNSRDDISNSILSSELFGKEFQGLPIPGSFEEEDEIFLEFYAIEEDVYQYYLEFTNLLFNDGGVFSAPPVNPSTNINNLTNPENKPLGFIQFSSVQTRSIMIKKVE